MRVRVCLTAHGFALCRMLAAVREIMNWAHVRHAPHVFAGG